MLLEDKDLEERVESPLNLLNRLRKATNPHSGNAAFIPSMPPALPPSAGDIIKDLDSKISNGSIKGKAMSLIGQAMDELKLRMPEVNKPQELAVIAAQMTKVVQAVEPNQQVAASAAQIIIYAPRIMTEDTFNIVELNEI